MKEKIVFNLKRRFCRELKAGLIGSCSMGGGAQLIQSLLFSFQVYWCSLFVLSQRVLKEVEDLLKDFLWTGASLKHTSANIQWYMVCSPKMEGAWVSNLLKNGTKQLCLDIFGL